MAATTSLALAGNALAPCAPLVAIFALFSLCTDWVDCNRGLFHLGTQVTLKALDFPSVLDSGQRIPIPPISRETTKYSIRDFSATTGWI